MRLPVEGSSMNRRSARLLPGFAATVIAPTLLSIGALSCHSEPFGNPFIGAIGPLVPGLEERLTYADTNEDGAPFQATAPHWAADGSGIIYSFSPRPYLPGETKVGLRCVTFRPCRPAAADPADTCLAMLPPTGGSAYWNVCESRSGHSNVDDYIAAGDINSAGQLLYTEQTAMTAPQQFTAPSPPVAYADLWLAVPTSPSRPELCQFSANADPASSLPQAPACGVGVLTAIQWLGTSTFAAQAGPIVLGTITANGVSFAAVPGTGGATAYAVVDGGRGAIFISGDSLIRHVTFADGTMTVVATLSTDPASVSSTNTMTAYPAGVGQLLDVGCHPDVCIVLTNGGGTWNLWKVDRATGSSAIVRTFTHELYAAKLSPTSGDVVALEGANTFLMTITGATGTVTPANLYLLTGVVP